MCTSTYKQYSHYTLHLRVWICIKQPRTQEKQTPVNLTSDSHTVVILMYIKYRNIISSDNCPYSHPVGSLIQLCSYTGSFPRCTSLRSVLYMCHLLALWTPARLQEKISVRVQYLTIVCVVVTVSLLPVGNVEVSNAQQYCVHWRRFERKHSGCSGSYFTS
jgi:hypothetical protein